MTPTAASLIDRTLSDIVNTDSRAAGVLERFGLDYCCGGRDTLAEAASKEHLPLETIVTALAALGEPDPVDQDRHLDEPDVLARHIVQRHHGYVRDATPRIETWLAKLVARHGTRHPELTAVRETFTHLSADLATHMAKEETLLFPVIEDLVRAHRAGMQPPSNPFGTVLHPVRVMEDDHRAAGDLLRQLRALTHDYTPPEDGCTTYRLCYAELARFEADLHQHVHLENNVLFPRALDIEQQLG